MKGVVFTEFFEFVEETYSPEFLQETIADSQIASGGVYTSVGTYPVCEMGALVGSLSKRTGHDSSQLLKLFGRHLFRYFHASSPHFFEGVTCPFDFLASVETKIHVDVKEECLLHFKKQASISRELKSEDPVTVIQFSLQA